MRLHRVRLVDFRGVADCEVSFAPQGVTVVEGPNEIGKTSISDGLDIVLRLMDSSKRQEVKSVQPVGRDVGPSVEVEISSGPHRFVYTKQWLRRPFTTLRITEPKHEQFSGREAHQKVEKILDKTLDWELWEALCVEQGTTLSMPSFDLPSLGKALDRAAEGLSAADREDDLWTRVCEERDRYWTAAGRPSAARKNLERQRDEVAERVAELKGRLDVLNEDALKVEALTKDAARLSETAEKSRQTIKELSERLDSARELQDAEQRLAAKHSIAEERHERLLAEQKSRQQEASALVAQEDEHARLEDEAQQALAPLAAATAEAERTRKELEDAQAALLAAEVEQRRADEDRDHHRHRIEVQQLRERRERASDASKALGEAEAKLAAVKVSDDLLEQIEQAHLDVVRAEAAVASVETTALREITLRVDSGDMAVDDAMLSNVVLGAGDVERRIVEDEVVLTIADVAEVRVRAGAGSRSEAAKRRRAAGELRRLCDEGGVADPAGARRASEERKQAERQQFEASATLSRELDGLTSDVLQAKIEALDQRLASYADRRAAEPHSAADQPIPADLETAEQIADHARSAVDGCRQEYDRCTSAAQAADEALSEQRDSSAALSSEIAASDGALRHARSRLEDTRAQRADGDIAAELVAAAEKVGVEREALEAVQAKLSAADPESLNAMLDNARGAEERAARDLQSCRDDENRLRIRLEVEGERGPHTLHTNESSRLASLERERRGIEARAEAAKLLHDTFERRRTESRQRYVGPFKKRIERLGRIVFHSSFEVEIDENLEITKRTLNGDTLEVDQLSTGAREQIGLLSRLACAAIVSPDGGGAPVIIDDALGWSDPGRLERMGAAIAAAGQQCQVIVLTCTPGRYAHIGSATTIRLPNQPAPEA